MDPTDIGAKQIHTTQEVLVTLTMPAALPLPARLVECARLWLVPRDYGRMTGETQIIVTLPTDLVAQLETISGDVSVYVSELVAHDLRLRGMAEDVERYEREHGAFTAEEIEEARDELRGISRDRQGRAQ
jgi:hypothetical protein